MSKPRTQFESPLPRLLADSVFARMAEAAYRKVITMRNTRFDRLTHPVFRARLPVVSIGGLRAGGSGKTPATMLLIDHLTKQGYSVAVASRGYKRKAAIPVVASPDTPVTWETVGDEPAMMRAAFPHLWLGIGANRSSSIALLQKDMGAPAVVLLDDGFQHRAVYRNCDIVCIHETLFEDRLLPAGYLREPVESLTRAHAVFIIASDSNLERCKSIKERLSLRFSHLECFILMMETEGWVDLHTGVLREQLPISNPVALCGIARPERFFTQLDEQAISCCAKKSFPDHYNFQEYDILSLRKLYSQGLVTTEKDAIRLKSLKTLAAMNVWYLKMRLRFAENDSSDRFNHYIKGKIENNSV